MFNVAVISLEILGYEDSVRRRPKPPSNPVELPMFKPGHTRITPF